ncbi:MAG TPA: sugar phosphate isomerase/epimerase family protein, partial [Bryobacteraceae bacterium]|nr:sugar phosphate isomerase/epimerase family protein [Bryobacteraceae bacterium]
MDRRTFLTTSVAAAALRANAQISGVFIALNNSLTGGQPGSANGPARVLDYPDFLQMAARTGYGGADVTLGNAMKLDAATVKARLDALHLRPGLGSQIPALFGKDPAAFDTNLAKLNECARFMQAIACNTTYGVIMPSSDIPKPEQRAIFLERMRKVSDLLLPYEIRFGVKFIGLAALRQRQPFEFIWHMDEMLEFVTDCGPNIGIMLDSWHWHLAGATPADIVAAGRSRITSVHLSDAKPLPAGASPVSIRDDQRVLPGEGAMDLAGFLGALQKIGYTGAISPEPLGR